MKGELPLPYCCGNVTAQYLMCSSTTGCSQSMYLYECVGTGDIGANKVTVYCCGVPNDSLTYAGPCMLAGPNQPASASGPSRTRPVYVLDCSGKYILVNLRVSEG